MAYGDIGGAVTELCITCKTKAEGAVHIKKGDALRLVGPYTVDNEGGYRNCHIFGQALTDADENSTHITVRVRGICIFEYVGDLFFEGAIGVHLSASAEKPGTVGSFCHNVGDTPYGTIVKVDEDKRQVHVLI